MDTSIVVCIDGISTGTGVAGRTGVRVPYRPPCVSFCFSELREASSFEKRTRSGFATGET